MTPDSNSKHTFAISSSDNVGLNCIIGGIGGVAMGHDTLIEDTDGLIAFSLASVAPDCKAYPTLLAHRLISTCRAWSVVHRLQLPCCCITSFECHSISSTFQHCCDKLKGERRTCRFRCRPPPKDHCHHH